jgi:hypothetical protein
MTKLISLNAFKGLKFTNIDRVNHPDITVKIREVWGPKKERSATVQVDGSSDGDNIHKLDPGPMTLENGSIRLGVYRFGYAAGSGRYPRVPIWYQTSDGWNGETFDCFP